ncbi:uncharacterized protein LY89DRAFT_247911 [Mollisia scopiformis]|uniref:Ubiquinol-cytochrome-c reductase complex assembly factor 2 n=1 Tax=Mollisia scopiformis TaxID=149040 RepID=A0A194WSI7_MOLSC|nr:uncharacterized protein LY89DRAFT_247911 [Mollisia scopiformis]KUJ10649.1 hypothetical protein LY89DRAFT_247911 [Mollisia scopiformis]
MSKSIAYKHYIRALSRWPKDNLRPDCQFQDVMRKRLDRRFIPASSPNTPNAAQAVANSAIDEKMELEQANAIYSLLENRYSRKYPIDGSLMRPASNPTHFEDLMKELQEAPERSWWGSMTNRWKGFLRFQ